VKPEVLQERLLARARENRLGHFYIFNGRGGLGDPQADWAEQFIRRFWSEIENHAVLPKQLRDDADLLWLRPPVDSDGDAKDYRVEDFDPLWRFLPYRALRGGRRFVVVEDAHRVSVVVANKLLKTLEEPEGLLTHLWLNPSGQPLLPTIESRAINLSLHWPITTAETYPQLAELRPRLELGELSLAEFLDMGKTGRIHPRQLLEELLGHESQHPGPEALKQELLTLTQEWEKAENYHQPIAPRLQWMHTILSQRFRAGR
jgi:hypothetical protein